MLGLLAAAPAHASEELEVTKEDTSGLHRPPTGPPPQKAAAELLVRQLLEQVHTPDPEWLRMVVRPTSPSVPASDAWYERMANALGPSGALGQVLLTGGGIAATFEGPDYQRVVLATEPLLTVVVKNGDQGAPVIDRIEPSSCALCPEPARFVRDLLADVAQRHTLSGRLLPGIELYVEGWLDENPDVVPHFWLAALQARNQHGGALADLLIGADLRHADASSVTLLLTNGSEERWPLRYLNGQWLIDYNGLSEHSPLRLSTEESDAWRDRDLRARSALFGWTPTWRETPDGAGLEVGTRAIGADFDPRDGSLIIAVLDLDRILAGIYRVDADRHLVLERFAVPPPGSSTPIPVGSWFDQWQLALDPEARAAAVTQPSRLHQIDLSTGEQSPGDRIDIPTALAWGEDGKGTVLVVGEDTGAVRSLDDEGRWRVDLGAAPVWLGVQEGVLLGVTEDGRAHRHEATRTLEAPICDGPAVDAALHPDGTELLITCGLGSSRLGARVQVGGLHAFPIAGAPAGHGGASYSPDGRYFTTPATGEGDPLLLWDAQTEQPLARFGVGRPHSVRWSADGSRIVTVGTGGRVWLWDLATVRHARGL